MVILCVDDPFVASLQRIRQENEGLGGKNMVIVVMSLVVRTSSKLFEAVLGLKTMDTNLSYDRQVWVKGTYFRVTGYY